MHFVTGRVSRVGGDKQEMRVEMETDDKRVITLISYRRQGHQVASFVEAGKRYTFEYTPAIGEDYFGTINGIRQR